jgi:hypothetical protein
MYSTARWRSYTLHSIASSSQLRVVSHGSRVPRSYALTCDFVQLASFPSRVCVMPRSWRSRRREGPRCSSSIAVLDALVVLHVLAVQGSCNVLARDR